MAGTCSCWSAAVTTKIFVILLEEILERDRVITVSIVTVAKTKIQGIFVMIEWIEWVRASSSNELVAHFPMKVVLLAVVVTFATSK